MKAASSLPLQHLRVVDLCDEKAELAGRLLADLGADVLRVEPPGGGASRHIGPFAGDESLYFAVRNANKRTVTVDISSDAGRTELLDLLAGADIWLESARPGLLAAAGLDPDEVARRFPGLVIVSVTDFGQTGPYRDFLATDPVMVGLSWMLFRAGVPELPPVLPPGALAYDIAGIMGAFAAVTGFLHRARTGCGQHIDLSVMESVAQTTDWGLGSYSVMARAGATGMSQVRSGGGQIYPIVPCKDGWVRPSMVSRAEWHKVRAWLGEPAELQGAELDETGPRIAIYESVIRPLLVDLFAPMTMIEAAEEGQRRRIPITPLLRPSDVLAAPHYRELGTFVEGEVAPGISGSVASGFYLMDGERVGFRAAASPAPGGSWRSEERLVPELAPARRPYEGMIVLDFGVAGAAPEIARLLAEYGADVIRVESPKRPDLFRQLGGPSGVSPVFASSSRTKRSLGVDFEQPDAIALVRELVRRADLVVENLPPGTMERWGLGPDAMRALNPDLITVSSQTMGSHGPWRDWRGYGANTQPPGGMTYLWSVPGAPEPVASNVAFPDHVVGRLGAVAAAACLGALPRARRGRHLEIVQAEVGINLLADRYVEESRAPGTVHPLGNRSDRGVPWGVYPCAGCERWCVITCRDDTDDWRGIVAALGSPAWATPDLDTAAGRRARAEEIDRHLEAWTSVRDDRDVMATLQAHGVPAGYMLYVGDTATDPHFVARGYPMEIDQPGIGPMLMEGSAFRSAELPAPLTSPAPLLGEHTRAILVDLLGHDAAEVDDLLVAGTVFGPPRRD